MLADDDMRVFWNRTLHIESADGQFSARIGGRLHFDAHGLTAGVNGYLDSNARVMANYVLTNVDNASFDDGVSAFQMRFQVTF